MEFRNQTPTGQDDPRLARPSGDTFHPWIEVEVYDQAARRGGIRKRAVSPLWTHTFTAQGEAVFTPAEEDGRRYKVRVIARWQDDDDGESGESVSLIEHLAGDGPPVIIEPLAGHPRDVTVTTGLDASGTSLFEGGGTLYRVDEDGRLVRYRHDAAGVFDNYGDPIGLEWGGLRSIHAVRGNGLYAIGDDGLLRYYHHHEEPYVWDHHLGLVIGEGWSDFPWVGVGRFGQLHATTATGDLLLYRHDDAFRWTVEAEKIGEGWPSRGVFAGGGNRLYVVDDEGDLLLYEHDDDLRWARERVAIGKAWGDFASVASSGNGEIYAVTADGQLLFYRHGADLAFLPGSGRTIGVAWDPHQRFGVLPAAR